MGVLRIRYPIATSGSRLEPLMFLSKRRVFCLPGLRSCFGIPVWFDMKPKGSNYSSSMEVALNHMDSMALVA